MATNSFYTRPEKGQVRYIMKFEDYHEHGFKKELATKEEWKPPVWPHCKRKINYKE